MNENSPTFAEFNPSNDERIDFIKSRTDELIAYMQAIVHKTPEGSRRKALACTNYEQAAMWAVKSLF